MYAELFLVVFLEKYAFNISDYEGGRGVKNTQKFDHVVYGWPLIYSLLDCSLKNETGFF